MSFCVFRGKDRKDRFQGIVTKVGLKMFKYHRGKLAQLVGVEKEQVSDGDTMEYLARGHRGTLQYIWEQGKDREAKDRAKAIARDKHRRAKRRVSRKKARAAKRARAVVQPSGD